MVTLTIDGTQVTAEEGTTVLQAALAAGIYIPHLCFHPDLPASREVTPLEVVYRGTQSVAGGGEKREFEGCQLCVVEVEGVEGFPTACTTPASEGLVVRTATAGLVALRQDNLVAILVKHPHACLTCAQREGCSREPCSLKVEVVDRCCPKLGRCELQKLAEYVGIKKETPRYVYQNLPVVRDEPFFDRDYNLCIGCLRCVRVCHDLRGVSALGYVWRDGEVVVGSVGPSLEESGCKFCGACVEVCPTGTLLDRDIPWTEREQATVRCRHACPAGIDVPRYVRLVSQGRFPEAAVVVAEKVPFPAVLGRVCFHPCEDECRRGQVNEPIAIRGLKRFAAECDTGIWRQRLKKAPATHKRVAVVGSGPAGLTAAFYLAKQGHAVTVFEASSQPGGMMRAGIPTYRLPRQVLDAEIKEIKSAGVDIKTSSPVDNLDSLFEQGFDAVFVAVGAHKAMRTGVPGEDSPGVAECLSLLRDVNAGKKVSLGDRVVVVGGGNSAVDAARVALRLGAKEVNVVCLESHQEMPAFEWEVQAAEDEGIILNCSWGPRVIMGDGRVTGIEFIRCTSVFDAEGRFNPSFDESIRTSITADTVVIAIGQVPQIPEDFGLRTGRGSTIEVDPVTLATDRAGVFAGGDAVTGPASVIEAVAAGRKAAISIDRYLGGGGDIDEALVAREEPSPWLGREEDFASRARAPLPCLPAAERLRGFAEVELGYGEDAALAEARRCLKCDLRFELSAMVLPPERWLEYNPQNVEAVPEVEGVYHLLDEERNAILISGTMNLRQGLEEHLGAEEGPLAGARYFGYEENPMYTARESELLQQYLQEHGSLPEGNEDLFF